MRNDWLTRLRALIEEDPRSYRQISTDAKLGVNFVQQLLSYDKDPRASQLASLFETLGPGAELYVLMGVKLSPKEVGFLKIISNLDDDARENVLALTQRLAANRLAVESKSHEGEKEPDPDPMA